MLENNLPLDVFAKLANDRAFFINGLINDSIASEICASLLAKDLENNKQIYLFINSSGGYVQDILSIYDTMKILKSPIRTIALGEVSAESVLLLAAGQKGERYISKNSHIILTKLYHNSGTYGDMKAAKIHMNFLQIKTDSYMNSLSDCLGIKLKDLNKILENDVYLFAEDAIKFGIVDKLVKVGPNGNKVSR